MGLSDIPTFSRTSPIVYCSLEKKFRGISSGVFVGFPSESTTLTKMSKVLSTSDRISLVNIDNCNAVGRVEEI